MYGKTRMFPSYFQHVAYRRCFKQLFTPVLSGILECDPHKIWTFERYFTEVEEVLSKAVIEVFCVQSAVLHRIYISPQKTYEFTFRVEDKALSHSAFMQLTFNWLFPCFSLRSIYTAAVFIMI